MIIFNFVLMLKEIEILMSKHNIKYTDEELAEISKKHISKQSFAKNDIRRKINT